MAQHYRCAWCKGDFSSTNVAVDHIHPVVDPVKGFESWDEFIKRLYCEKDNLQVLCKECHTEKSALERDIRTKQRKKKDVS